LIKKFILSIITKQSFRLQDSIQALTVGSAIKRLYFHRQNQIASIAIRTSIKQLSALIVPDAIPRFRGWSAI
jgi:hypothetical protein